ncbi:hypothetical protein J6590_011675 [Homalodisca vitripennis]|nr:hypothetical protein J6590_011675 [Homalodisca vitripennis]
MIISIFENFIRVFCTKLREIIVSRPLMEEGVSPSTSTSYDTLTLGTTHCGPLNTRSLASRTGDASGHCSRASRRDDWPPPTCSQLPHHRLFWSGRQTPCITQALTLIVLRHPPLIKNVRCPASRQPGGMMDSGVFSVPLTVIESRLSRSHASEACLLLGLAKLRDFNKS